MVTTAKMLRMLFLFLIRIIIWKSVPAMKVIDPKNKINPSSSDKGVGSGCIICKSSN